MARHWRTRSVWICAPEMPDRDAIEIDSKSRWV
jgi:hypothetical protein